MLAKGHRRTGWQGKDDAYLGPPVVRLMPDGLLVRCMVVVDVWSDVGLLWPRLEARGDWVDGNGDGCFSHDKMGKQTGERKQRSGLYINLCLELLFRGSFQIESRSVWFATLARHQTLGTPHNSAEVAKYDINAQKNPSLRTAGDVLQHIRAYRARCAALSSQIGVALILYAIGTQVSGAKADG